MNKDFLSYLLNVLFKKMNKLTLCFFDQIVVAIGMKYLYWMDKNILRIRNILKQYLITAILKLCVSQNLNYGKIIPTGKIRVLLPWKCHNLLFIVLIYREEEAFIPRLAFRDRILCSCIHHFLLLFSFYHLNICHLQFDYENIFLYSKGK